MIAIGDLIEHNRERGIVCTVESPRIMRCVDFHSYVVYDDTATLLKHDVEPDVTIRSELVERIRRYYEMHTLPTGASSSTPSTD